MENARLLTTFDNPFNPFVDFKKWYLYDCEKEHNTSSRIARLMETNYEMTEKEIDEEEDRVMDFILKYDLEGKYFKGTEEEIQKWLDLNNKRAKVEEKQPEPAAEAQ
jgi:hypothetical protein